MYERTFKNEYLYPWNAIFDIYQIYEEKERERLINSAVVDLHLSFAYLLSNVSMRKQSILVLFYRDNETLEEIGKRFGLTRERVRQIKKVAEAEIKRTRSIEIIQLGLNRYVSDLEKKVVETDVKIAAATKQYTDKIEAILEENKRLHDIIKRSTEISPVATENSKKPLYFEPIEVLDLSNRSQNVLHRNKIHSVADLCKIKTSDLIKFRNLGVKSYNEILRKMTENGLLFE